jgi:hypothetical protein
VNSFIPISFKNVNSIPARESNFFYFFLAIPRKNERTTSRQHKRQAFPGPGYTTATTANTQQLLLLFFTLL